MLEKSLLDGLKLLKNKMNFIEINLNPKKKKVGDCVVRSISMATGRSWSNVFKELFEIALKEYSMPNSKEVAEIYLLKRGFTKMKMPKHQDNTKYTVRQLVDEKKATMVIQVANHFVASVDGNLYDTWNCSQKSVYNYYIKQ